MSRTRFVGSLFVICAVTVCAACTGGSAPPTGPTAVSPAVSAAAAAMAGHPATVVETPAGPTVRAPLFTVARPDGDGVVVVTMISVGGGPVIPVQVDTGSSGLVVDATAVGPATRRFADTPESTTYLSGTVSGILGEASVTIGPVGTAPIGMELAELPAGSTAFGGTRGVLGVGSTNTSQANESEPAPQLALPAPFDRGQSFTVAAAGPGTWTLGPVTAPAGAQALPLLPATPEPGAPPVAAGSGLRFAKDVTLCWTVGSRPPACGATDLDLGATDTALNSADDPTLDAGGGYLAPGQPIGVTGPQSQPVWAFTTGETTSSTKVKAEPLGATTRFNTGVAFFLTHTVAWDYTGGHLLVAPAAP